MSAEHLPLPPEVCIAVENTPTPDGRMLLAGAINWQLGHAVPLRSAREGGETIGFVRVNRIKGLQVMATVHVAEGALEEAALRLDGLNGLFGKIGFGVDLDRLGMRHDSIDPIVIVNGRLRAVTVIEEARVSWPECVMEVPGE